MTNFVILSFISSLLNSSSSDIGPGAVGGTTQFAGDGCVDRSVGEGMCTRTSSHILFIFNKKYEIL